MDKELILTKVRKLLDLYSSGKLGDTTMPEDTHPVLNNQEDKLLYYTLPMALNYQRNSYKLWESAKQTWEDETTKQVFDIKWVYEHSEAELREKLLKYKLALQPNKHTDTWKRISETIYRNWRSIPELIECSEKDFLYLKKILQKEHKKGFPYLSGPKIFNYWSYILTEYCEVDLKHRSFIEIAPDTHVLQSSVRLSVIDEDGIGKLSREEVSKIWRNLLEGTGINPIDVHSPLWFWSRGGFKVKV